MRMTCQRPMRHAFDSGDYGKKPSIPRVDITS
jgi:hypothetical protein